MKDDVVAQVRRGPGGRGAGLSATDIVAVALDLLDRHGAEWLTMRKLADALGVSVSALYWHFPNRDSLLEAVVGEVALELRWDASVPGAPRERLTGHLRALHAHWRRHPVLVELGQRFRPAASGEFSAEGIAILRGFGFDDADALRHWRALVWLVLGFFYVEQGVRSSAHHVPVADAPGRYAVSLGATPEIVDTDEVFELLLGLALDGVEQAAVRPG